MLGDDLIDERDPLLPAMLAVHERTGGAVVALMEVDPEQVHLYGVATVGARSDDGSVRILDLVEKPAREDAPSTLAVIGRYVLGPEVFGVLAHTPPGKGGEIQLTDALRELAADPDGPGVYGVVFSGRRYDTGTVSTTSRRSCSSRATATTSVPSCAHGSSSSPRAWIPCPLLRLNLRCRRHPTDSLVTDNTGTVSLASRACPPNPR